eukprot:CAMPEP_0203940974 /NCGR_PEP_ID=MMETSP0359-20131031/77436_1 /ASSEMBLY_ACC=CAM_ASM_000338 /TAXON_ID=268821 /ORGANISM="Scrippsiella Hangoei, Strain SHTV-5" /LENGTH=48 /DNA_ID= /DNA_START= /DNA_END= /DNA_ORIENTATION=
MIGQGNWFCLPLGPWALGEVSGGPQNIARRARSVGVLILAPRDQPRPE